VARTVASAVVLARLVTGVERPDERLIAMAVYMFVILSGGPIGPRAAGYLTQPAGWH
jgi:hypothetical protein